MKKMFIVLFMVVSMVMAGSAIAEWNGIPGYNPAGKGFINLNGNAFWKQGDNGDNGCNGSECNASGNFDVSAFAIGGGVDADGILIENGGAGGVSAAGGIAGSQAEGSFETGKIYGWVGPKWYNWGWKTVNLGGAEGYVSSTAGGFANTSVFDLGSSSITYAVADGSLDVSAWGLAASYGSLYGAVGQGSLDGSVIGSLPVWNSNGMSYGVAGQGSVGGFAGFAGVAGWGSAGVDAGIEMQGSSYTNSYRTVIGNTEYMGTFVETSTLVNSYGYAYNGCFGVAFVDGGFNAAGFAKTATVQTVDGGFAKATANGSYAGSGKLGCNFNGSAAGYTHTSATQVPGMNGSVMSSSAGMRVTSGNPGGDSTPK